MYEKYKERKNKLLEKRDDKIKTDWLDLTACQPVYSYFMSRTYGIA